MQFTGAFLDVRKAPSMAGGTPYSRKEDANLQSNHMLMRFTGGITIAA
jgi:hypothetical protein